MFYLRGQRDILGMMFEGSDGYDETLESIAGFVEKEIAPTARKTDEEGSFPRRNLQRLSDQGIFAISFPTEYGGAGLPFPVYVAALEILAKGCANTALQVSIQGMICEGIRLFGSEEQKKRFLRDRGLVEGKGLIAFALTEPCCGSDAGALQARAVKSAGGYVLYGTKTLITNPGESDHVLLFARTDAGISAFIVASGAPGLAVGKTIPKLGFRGNQLSSIRLEDCRVPEEDLLGEEGMGLEYAKQMLNFGRVTISAIGVGIGQAAYEKSVLHGKTRRAFGKSIAEFEMTREKLADMSIMISAGRLMTYHAAYLRHRGKDIATAASQAKLFTSEAALRVCDGAIQIHGGYGYTDASDVHRHWRDARLLTIGEGTSEMLRLLIGRRVLKEGSHAD